MKVTQPRTQFDHPESVASPATPSCCCCCCCCVATIVSTAALGAITANHQARRFSRHALLPTLLALLALPLGTGAGVVIGVTTRDAAAVIVGGSLVAVIVWWLAFYLAAPMSDEWPTGRSFKYLVLFLLSFALEFVVGLFLLALYVVPYVLAAGTVIYLTISRHLKNQRAQLNWPVVPPAAWTPPTDWPSRPGTPWDQPGPF